MPAGDETGLIELVMIGFSGESTPRAMESDEGGSGLRPNGLGARVVTGLRGAGAGSSTIRVSIPSSLGTQ
jgi:hypothetical protein